MSITGTPPAPRTGALRATSLRTWHEPSGGAAARGTVAALVGRGETAEVDERFGRRLAADGYRVVAVGDEHAAPRAVADLLAPLPAPHVVVDARSTCAAHQRVLAAAAPA